MNLGLSAQFRRIIKDMKDEYNNEIWPKLSDDHRADSDPERFINEVVRDGHLARGIVELNLSNSNEKLDEAASKHGVICEMGQVSGFGVARYAVLGIDQGAVQARMAEHAEEMRRRRKRKALQREENDRAKRLKMQTEDQESMDRINAARFLEKADLIRPWDIEGTWQIHCSEIREHNDEISSLEDNFMFMEIAIIKSDSSSDI